MTNYEVLLILLEESRKHEYASIMVCTNRGWKKLTKIDILQTSLYEGTIQTENRGIQPGYLIQLRGCIMPESTTSRDNFHVTIDRMTTTFCPYVKDIYLCYEKT